MISFFRVKPLCDKMSLISFHVTFQIPHCFKFSNTTNKFRTFRQWGKIPSIIVFHGFNLVTHGIGFWDVRVKNIYKYSKFELFSQNLNSTNYLSYLNSCSLFGIVEIYLTIGRGIESWSFVDHCWVDRYVKVR